MAAMMISLEAMKCAEIRRVPQVIQTETSISFYPSCSRQLST